MWLSFALVLFLNITIVQSRPQDLPPSGEASIDLDAASNVNCTCTPFYKCYDEEANSDLYGIVDDRLGIIDYRPVNTTAQADEPGTCRDILETCCYNLDPSSPQPHPQSTSQLSTQTPTMNPSETSELPDLSQALSPDTNDEPKSPTMNQSETPEPPGLFQTIYPDTNDELLSPTTIQLPLTQQSTPSTVSPQLPNVMPTSSPKDVLQFPVTGHPMAGNGECGVRSINGVDFTVKGFTDGQAQYGEFPWMVALLTSNTSDDTNMCMKKKYQYIGGGSLIDPQVVLTVAHKPYDLEAYKTITVRVGEWNFQTVSEPTQHQDIPVKEVIMHPRFHRGSRVYNYALLVLERPAVLGKTVGTICLPSNPEQRFDGEQCVVTGWGADAFGDEGRYHEKILKLVSVNMVDHSQCQSAFQTTHLGNSFSLHQSFVCAGDKGQDACTGDGGSPLVCPDPSSPGHYIQVGASAWGIGCGQIGIPGVYSSVAPVLDWIQEQLSNINALVVDQPTQGVDEPGLANDKPTPAVGDPTQATNEPTLTINKPTKAADEPTSTTNEPTQAADEPAPATDEPTQAVDKSSILVDDRISFFGSGRCYNEDDWSEKCKSCRKCQICQKWNEEKCKCYNIFRCNIENNRVTTMQENDNNQQPSVSPLQKPEEIESLILLTSEINYQTTSQNTEGYESAALTNTDQNDKPNCEL